MNRNRFYQLVVAILIVVTAAFAAHPLDVSDQKEVEHSVIRGLKFLASQQEDDGSWQHYPAVTALVLSAFMRSHPALSTEDPLIHSGYEFLAHCVQKDGGIYVDDMANYNTSICVVAFEDSRDAHYHDILNHARRYLMSRQLKEDSGYTPDSLFYGGMGYATKEKPADMSNLQWALEAMSTEMAMPEQGTTPDDLQQQKLFWDRAVIFLARCQNLQQQGSPEYTGNDGGFMYKPGNSKAGGTTSYGSMSYAGLKSFLHARVDRDDARVQAVWHWLEQNWNLDENPGMGTEGLYYYYHTMAKALNAYNEDTVVDSRGVSHHWRSELTRKLVSLQDSSGMWVNSNGRWWENNPVLVTAYTVLALEEAAGLPHHFSTTQPALPVRE